MSLLYMPRKRRLACSDPFFDLGNAESNIFYVNKQLVHKDSSTDTQEMDVDMNVDIGRCVESLGIGARPIVCQDPPCSGSVSCPTAVAYERHYDQVHKNKCSECDAVFSSGHWLDLHIQECHDMFFGIRVDRGDKAFRCLLPSCQKTFSRPHKRKLHMIDKHHFPKSFNWSLVRYGSQPVAKNKRHGHQASKTSGSMRHRPQAGMDVSEGDAAIREQPDQPASASGMDVDQLTSAFKYSLRVGAPKTVSFGRRRGYNS